MKALFIDVEQMVVTEIEFPFSLGKIHELLGCKRILCPSFNDYHNLILSCDSSVNGRGFRVINSEYENFYAGNALITGYDCNGNWISHTLDINEAKKHIEFMDFIS